MFIKKERKSEFKKSHGAELSKFGKRLAGKARP
jgi:hypothetical protein